VFDAIKRQLSPLGPKTVFRNLFFRSVGTLAMGTALAQAILILFSPVLTRLYTPKDFGVLAFYTASVSILAMFACGRCETAIVILSTIEESQRLTLLSIVIAAVFALTLFCGNSIVDYFDILKLYLSIGRCPN